MNEKEEQILKLVKANPFVSQIEIAEKLGLSRSAVAGYISSLTRLGKLLGRAYVLPEEKKIICIGGANVDRKSVLANRFRLETSNPVDTSLSLGGVARNISENLGRIGANVHLMTIVGDDHEGANLLELTGQYVNTTASGVLPDASTGGYTAILNKSGNMVVAFADMGIYDLVDIDYIEKKWSHIASSSMVVLDTNLSFDVNSYILSRCKSESIPVCFVTVSVPKMDRLPDNLSGVHWIILNEEEAQVLSGCKIKDGKGLEEAADKIISKGAERVVITRGGKGLYFKTNASDVGHVTTVELEPVEVTGAGDSLSAGIFFGASEGYSTEECCQLGASCAAMTIMTKETVSPALNKESLLKRKQEIYHTKIEECFE